MSPKDVETGGGYGTVSGTPVGEPPRNSLDAWKSPIATVLAIVLFACGIATMFYGNTSCVIGGILQSIFGALIVACEGPLFLSFMSFVAPLSRFWDEKPAWVKTVFYVVIAVLSVCTGCGGLFYILGFLSALAIAIVYALVLFGPRIRG